MSNRKTIAIDFDGVLHKYSGWDGGTPKGLSFDMAREACKRLSQNYRLVLFTTRTKEQVEDWLKANGFDMFAQVTNEKVPWVCLLDDRVIQFKGVWDHELIEALEKFKAHWEL